VWHRYAESAPREAFILFFDVCVNVKNDAPQSIFVSALPKSGKNWLVSNNGCRKISTLADADDALTLGKTKQRQGKAARFHAMRTGPDAIGPVGRRF
tara:strand:- start:667 stop:957 length:291 start_codon:yes stop_codon:yes gene_type:complete